MATPPPSLPSRKSKGSRARRWLRRFLILILIVVGGYYLAMQSFLTRWVVMGQIGKLTGGIAQASGVILSPSGKIVIRDAKLRAPGVPGEAGVIFSVRRLEAEFAWAGLFTGSPTVHLIILDEPTARISQSVDDGTVNIAAIKPPKNASPPKEVPKVLVRGGVIELGEHVTDPKRLAAGAAAYTALKRIDVGGEVLESPDEQGAKIVSFHEVEGATPVPGGLAVQGRISQEGIRLTLEGLSLSTWNAESTPSPSRELFRQAAMQGEIPRAVITYAYSGGWEARIALSNVAINLPVTARPDEDDDGNPLPQSEADKKRLLRMEKVNGEMVFTNKGVVEALNGLMEELPYVVSIHVDGTSFDSPFVCTLESNGFALTKKPQIMKFAPGVARRRLDQFSNPTGIVNAKVTVTRGAPLGGKEAEVEVNGEIHFHDVTAAFEKFPYHFSKMVGEITFDANRVDLVSIDGQAPNGVKVHASGVIAPPTDAAAVDLDIHVTNLPIDEKVRQAMLGRRRVLDAIFSEERYQDLLKAGLVATTAQHEQAQADLARLEGSDKTDSDEARSLRAIAQRPVFELGGRAEVRVQIHRPLGMEADWEDTETISMTDVGVLPERVPYPLLADQIVINKTDTLATVDGGLYRGITGGTAIISAKADFSKIDDPHLPFIPEVSITALDCPVDPLLINCLPESEQLSQGASLHAMLTDLNAAGRVDCTVKLGMTPKNEPYFHVETSLNDLIARPRSREATGGARMMLSQVAGKVTVTESELSLSLTARAGHADGPGDPIPASIQFSMPIVAQLSDLSAPPPPPTRGLALTASARGLDASLPVEDLVAIFAPTPGKSLADLRAKLEPKGVGDVKVELSEPPGGGDTLTNVQIMNAHSLEVSALGGRVGIDQPLGGLSVTTSSAPGPGVIRASELSGPLMFNGLDAGHVALSGAIGTDWNPAPGSPGLSIQLRDGHLESDFTRGALHEMGPHSISDALARSSAKGVYDLDLRLGVGTAPGAAGAPVEGVFRPRTLELTLNEKPVVFTAVAGALEFAGTDGRLRDISLTAPGWSASGDGSWIQVPGGSTAFQTSLSLTSAGLPPDLMTVLPQDLRDAFADLSFDATGPVELSNGQLSMTFGDDGGLAAFKSTGRVALAGGKADVGATVQHIEGVLDYSVSRTTPDVPADFELWALLDRFSLSGVAMTNGRVRAASGARGEVLVPLISADCHGGRVAGTAIVAPPENGKRHYEVQLQASDVRLASVLADFQSEAQEDPTHTPLAQLADESRGRLDLGLSLAGTSGDLASRRGRGTATVGGGRIVNIPLLVPLIRVTNLQLPINERLDYAYADFYIEGREMVLSEVSISSRSVGVYGYGVATLPEMNLNLRFRSKSRARIPLITGAVEFLRNELAMVEVTGTLGKPKMGLVPLSGASRVLGRMFGNTPTEQQRALNRIEQRAEKDPHRPEGAGHAAIEPQ